MNADQLRAARALTGLTQLELAQLAGLSDPTIRAIEDGTASPRESTIKAIEAALAKRGAWLIGDHGVSNRPPKSKSKQKGKSNAKAVS